MTRTIRALAVAAAAAAAAIGLFAGAAAAQADAPKKPSLHAVKHAWNPYRTSTPPGRVVFANGDVSCFSMPGKGAMGVHYVDPALVGDGQIDPLNPEAIIYEPKANGSVHIVGIEYVVFKADWDAAHSKPPMLFGHRFDTVLAPNMFGLPDNYSLHVWLWRDDPRGLFRPWNPAVHCLDDAPMPAMSGHLH